ncbi:NAD(P)-binding protein [Viridothelium virens]|uniref:NAD(P)-binding protein n=1 Tax=Viridothelium virens TaxID=1048519 RepID=A0A6A6HME2_VIRVR|nr:NAD(P)-binding protein [Viridothelium virens]
MTAEDMDSKRIILITGSNRGIGLAIATRLAKNSPNDHCIIGSRSRSDGEIAIAELRGTGTTASLEALQLDINDDSSIHEAIKYLTRAYGRLDILINNAAIAKTFKADPQNPEFAATYRTNYSNTYFTNVISTGLFTELMRPLLYQAAHPRVINVSSARGSLGRFS